MPDLHRISKRFQKGATQNASGQLEDVVRVYQAILKVPDLIRVLADAEVPSDEHRRLVDETYVQPLKVRRNGHNGRFDISAHKRVINLTTLNRSSKAV